MNGDAPVRPRPPSSIFRAATLLAAILLSAVAATPGHADALDDAVGGLVQEAPYADARAKLLAAGWSAAVFDMGTIDGRCSFRQEICTVYPEAESCSGTGMGFCLFRFEAGDGRRISITTAGEEIDDLVVYGWAVE